MFEIQENMIGKFEETLEENVKVAWYNKLAGVSEVFRYQQDGYGYRLKGCSRVVI